MTLLEPNRFHVTFIREVTDDNKEDWLALCPGFYVFTQGDSVDEAAQNLVDLIVDAISEEHLHYDYTATVDDIIDKEWINSCGKTITYTGYISWEQPLTPINAKTSSANFEDLDITEHALRESMLSWLKQGAETSQYQTVTQSKREPVPA